MKCIDLVINDNKLNEDILNNFLVDNNSIFKAKELCVRKDGLMINFWGGNATQ